MPISKYSDHQKVQTIPLNVYQRQQQPLVMPFLNDVLPAIVLQKRIVRSRIGSALSFACPHLFPILLHLGRSVVRIVMVLLLLMSGDVELNPGPVGEYFIVACEKDTSS